MSNQPKGSDKPPKEVVEEESGGEEGEEDGNADGGVAVELKESGKRKKKPHLRKKKRKHNTSGFEGTKAESQPHAADANRYDPTLPFDQRLLRSVDEYRNLRGFNQDYKLAFQLLLNHFKIDVHALRAKHGKQNLRGFVYEEKTEANSKKGDEDDDGVDEVEMESGETEESWSKDVISSFAIARWLQDRANDRYGPYLNIAPVLMSNFLNFLLVRNVLPLQTNQIESVIPIANMAKVQLPNASGLFNSLIVDPFHRSLRTLFPTSSSILPSPISLTSTTTSEDMKEKEKIVVGGADHLIPLVISSASFFEGRSATEEELDQTSTPLVLPPSSSSSSPDPVSPPKDEGEDGRWKELPPPETDRIKIAQRIQKELEEEAENLNSWSKGLYQDEGEAREIVKAELERLGLDVEEREWRVGWEERSARTIEGWEKIEGLKKGGDLYRLNFSSHMEDFPITSLLTPPVFNVMGASHSLQDQISILVPSTYHKYFTPNLIIEADFVSLHFISSASSSNTATSSGIGKKKEVEVIWMLKTLWRILPSYACIHMGEALREEPSRVLDFPGISKEESESESEANETDFEKEKGEG